MSVARRRRPRLILDNRTDYPARWLRKWILAAMDERGVRLLHCRVVPFRSRSGLCGGFGWFPVGPPHHQRGRIEMKLPRPEILDRRDFAQTLLHEIDHTLGLRHREMLDLWLLPTEWSDHLPDPPA